MSKYLYMQDGHAKGVNSCNRIGDYWSDWLLKFKELVSIAKENKCEAILDGGDLVETKNPSYNVLDEIADIIEEGKIPMYSLFGNHSMNSGHIENSTNTGLAHLQRRSKYFKYLNRFESCESNIVGYEYYYGIEEDIKKNGIMIKVEEKGINDLPNQFNVAIVHALVTPKKFFENTSYITPDQIKTNADLVLLAHYHHPFSKKVGNTEFLNIGCFGRLDINEAKITPSVLLLDTDKRSYEVIKLKSAKLGNEVFNLTKYNELKGNKKGIEDFISSLKNLNFQGMEIGTQIVNIGKKDKKYDKAVKYLLDKIGD